MSAIDRDTVKVMAVVARNLIRAMGMNAENETRLQQGYSIAWPEIAFELLAAEIDEALSKLDGAFDVREMEDDGR